ncbi:ABC transporter permease [Aquipuribacter nitratireducens]|uniref:Transport permease protein n=1 Tax=Aquipuribacter nitratireducens TaxID=650104 RepID=A0ABW0GM12_9MICO
MASAGDRVTSEELAALGREHGLRPVGRRPSLGVYLAQLWDRRHFILSTARSGLASNTAQDRLGPLWLVLNPLLLGLAYYLIFGLLLGTSDQVEDFIGFLVIGIFLYQYTARAVSEGARAVTGNRRMIQVLAFPRAALPIGLVVRQALGFLPAVGVMLVVVLISPPVSPVTWHWLLLVPVLVLVTLFNLGVAFFAARLTAQVNDVGQLIPFLLRLWLYASGVFFDIRRLAADQPGLLAVLELNPVHIYLTLARDAVLYQTVSDARYWLLGTAWALVLTVLGFLAFWRAEEVYSRE